MFHVLVCLSLLFFGWPGCVTCAGAGASLPLKLPKATQEAPGLKLPSTDEEILAAMAGLQREIENLQEKRAGDAANLVSAWGATDAEVSERDRLVQEWLLALESRSRIYKRLQELRAAAKEFADDTAASGGLTAKPPYPISMLEDLRNRLAGQLAKASTLQTVLGIFEGNLARYQPILESDRKELRRLIEQAEIAATVERRSAWVQRMAELRVQVHEAAVHTAQIERLATTETLGAVRRQIESLKSQIQSAEQQVRFTAEDLNTITNQLQSRREDFQERLKQVLAGEKALRDEQQTVVAELRRAEAAGAIAATDKARLASLRAAADAVRARAETTVMKVEILRNLSALESMMQTCWADRFWVSTHPPILELRARRRQYLDDTLHWRHWNDFLQTRISSTLSDSLAYGLQLNATNLTSGERQAATAARASLDDRVAHFQEAMSELALAQTLKDRLVDEIDAAIAGAGISSRIQFGMAAVRRWLERVWRAELYIAEDNIIVDGQKISIPRSVTVGKVICGVLILMAGLMLARWVYRATEWLAKARFKEQPHAARLTAQGVGGALGLLALVVAMASVRIPWTVFAFMGGALVIGFGFGAQALIKNFISGVILLLERTVRMGDLVELDEHRGVIQRVGIRNSLLRRSDGADVLIPNSLFLEKKVVNWTLTDNLVRQKVSVGVAYGSDTEKVAAVMAAVAANHEGISGNPPPEVYFQDFGEKALLFTVDFWVAVEPGVDTERVRSRLLHRLHMMLENAGIFVPLTGRDLSQKALPRSESAVISETKALPTSGNEFAGPGENKVGL